MLSSLYLSDDAALCATCRSLGNRCILPPQERSTAYERRNAYSDSQYQSDQQSRYYKPLYHKQEDSRDQSWGFTKLRNQAANGCSLCSLVFAAFSEEEARLAESYDSPAMFHKYLSVTLEEVCEGFASTRKGEERLEFSWPLTRPNSENDYKGKSKLILIGFTKFEDRTPLYTSWSSASDPRSSRTDSAASMSQIADWIHDCDTIHKCCQHLRTKSFLPTRLLDFSKGKEDLRICSSSSLPRDTNYATLSHCWGNVSTSQLLQQNISQYQNKVPWSKLSKTFQEAVSVCVSLKLKYLWIDSLCIIQDLESDWEKEAVLMSQVYTNSFINIAATASHNSHEGLFRTRSSASLVATWDLTTRPETHTCVISESLLDRSTPQYVIFFNISLWETSITNAPLNRRAWVYQERALAPRIVHFASTEVFWECNSSKKSETFIDGIPAACTDRREKNLAYSLSHLDPRNDLLHGRYRTGALVQASSLGKILNFFVDINQKTFLDLWTHLVEDYSSCKLTFEKDKLVAISALAQNFARHARKGAEMARNEQWLQDSQKLLEDKGNNDTSTTAKFLTYIQSASTEPTYLAGLWSFQILEQMLWCVHSYRSSMDSRPIVYRAPSWSWASSESEVDYGPVRGLCFYQKFALATVLRATTVPISDPHGAVSGGNLYICGSLFKATLNFSQKLGYQLAQYNIPIYIRDEMLFLGSLDDPSHAQVLLGPNYTIYCLPLFAGIDYLNKHSRSGEIKYEMEGLLLSPTNVEPGQYQRVGTFCHVSGRYPYPFPAVRSQVLQSADSMREDTYVMTIRLEAFWPKLFGFEKDYPDQKAELQLIHISII